MSRVSITDLTEKQLEVIVDDTQLSLAIGKKGQNVRLAAKLLGWKIDIKSEEEKRQEVEQQMQALAGGPSTPIEQVTELGEGIIQKLVAAGITTVEALADMTPEQLEEIPASAKRRWRRLASPFATTLASLKRAKGPGAEAAEAESRRSKSCQRRSARARTPPTLKPWQRIERSAGADEVTEAEVLERSCRAERDRSSG